MQVAIIGISGRFPGTKNIEEFKSKVWDGTELITRYTEDQLIANGVKFDTLSDPYYVKAGSQLSDVECFDADFFGYSAREARALDPQQRIFLECAWEALERAGYSSESLSIPVGVFAGASANTYILDNILKGNVDLDLNFMNYVEARLGSDKDFLATRVSYKLNLTGPSFTIQSACSTSLVAVHTACQNLLNGECDLAIAGAVAVLYPLNQGYMHKPESIVSPDGHCRTFSANARGTVFGSGVGAVVLKRLEDAQNDRDNILAVIKGSAVNNDGALKPSYTTPSLDLQAEVVGDAMVLSDVLPETIGYVEAHGTGTLIGDPIEVAALTQAYREFTDRKQYCPIGSVKTNIGHLDVAAGMASLLKTVLVLQHKQIPPSLHFDQPNPQIDFENSPFYVNTELQPFVKGDTERRAALTALGVGGTNVHMILEEAPAVVPTQSKKPQIVLVSAKTSTGLAMACRNLAAHLAENKSLELADVAFTTQVGRRRFNWRRGFVGNDLEAIISQLNNFVLPENSGAESTNLRFIISSLSFEDLAHVSEIYRTQSTFRTAFDVCVKTWNEICLRVNSTADCLHLQPDDFETLIASATGELTKNILAFSFAYALTNLLMMWGIMPEALYLAGDGELVGACLAEALSLDAALVLLGKRYGAFGDHLAQLDSWLEQQAELESKLQFSVYGYRADRWLRLHSEDLSYSSQFWTGNDEVGDSFTLPAEATADSLGLVIAATHLLDRTELSHNKLVEIFARQDQANIYQKLLLSVASLWEHGVSVDWSAFHSEQPRRIVLPTYPFERKLYRYKQNTGKNSGQTTSKFLPANASPLIHNQLHSPAISKSVFECQLGLNNFPYLDDHRVYGQAIVPGSLHISLALSAAQELYGEQSVGLEGLLFGKALFVDESSDRLIQLIVETKAQDKNAAYPYQLISCGVARKNQADAWSTHSQGTMKPLPPNAADSLINLETIKKSCDQRVSHEEFYRRGLARGFEWQGDFRSLKAMWQGSGEALALLEYSDSLQKSIADYTVHPAILDACLQPYLLTTVASLHGDDCDPFIPLSISRLEFYRVPTKKVWIHAYLDRQATQNQDSLAVNLNLYDEAGQTVMKLVGLRAIRMLRQQLMNIANESRARNLDYIYRPVWQICNPGQELTRLEKRYQHLVIIDHGQDPWQFADEIARHAKDLAWSKVQRITLGDSWQKYGNSDLEIDRRHPQHYQELISRIPYSSTVYFLGGFAASQDLQKLTGDCNELEILERAEANGIYALLWFAKSLIAQQRQDLTLRILTHDLYRITIRDRPLYPFSGGLVGFAKVFAREQPQMAISCLDLSSADLEQMGHSSQKLTKAIMAIEGAATDVNLDEIAWRDGLYWRKKLVKELSFDTSLPREAFRHHGVYLILGGAGGIGVALSIFLAQKYRATSIWIGRSPISDEISASVAQVELAGGKAEYLQADATSLTAMQNVRTVVREKYGELNGVIHSALILRDRGIAQMNTEDFKAAFDIKARATLVLEQITRDDSLDFIAFFSSENAFRGWHGLCNYVAGCTFKDNYGAYLRQTKHQPVKIFNWGFWGEVGIAAQASIRRLIQKQGIHPMTTDEGLEIFATGLNRDSLQIVPTKIDARINEHLGIEPEIAIDRVNSTITTGVPQINQRLVEFMATYSGPTENSWLAEIVEWVRHLSLKLVGELGVNIDVGQSFQRQAIMETWGIEPKFDHLLAAIEDMLVEAGFLLGDRNRLYFTSKAQNAVNSGSILQPARFQQRYPQAAPWLELINQATQNFLPILKGRVKATDILFPKGSNQLIENIYRGNCVSDYFNCLATEAVISFVQQQIPVDAQNKVRILEFGAGTGSTTRVLLERLKQEVAQAATQIEYVFTDVSAHFTNKAQAQLAADYPFVSFQTFDMEKEPEVQGFVRGSFDLVLGTNVIHVCVDMLATVARLKLLLKQNGVLILNELTEINDVWTLTFGLLDGWWVAQDRYLRLPHTPLLSKDNWQVALESQGFANISIFTQPAHQNSDHPPQCLIVGESNGEIVLSTQINSSVVSKKEQSNVRVAAADALNITFTEVEFAEPAAREKLLKQYLKAKIAETLEISLADIPENKPIGDLGMDSLIVLDFCDRLSREMNQSIPTTMVFDYPTLEKIVEYVARDILQWQQADSLKPAFSPEIAIPEIKDGQEDAELELDALSPQQIEALLIAELE